MRLSQRQAFTLIELLLVIGIIAILASIVIVAINPTKQLGDARNTQRRSDVNTILSAVYQYAIDHNGTMPPGIPTGAANAKMVCQSWVDPTTCTTTLNGVNLRVLSGTYITGVPADPSLSVTGTGSRYWIYKDDSGRVTVFAPNAEQGATISLTR